MLREASDAFIDRIEAHWAEHGWGLWAVEVPGVVPFIGYVGLWPAHYVSGDPMVEVGWRLAREYWGNGYVTEAAGEALRFGFEVVGLDHAAEAELGGAAAAPDTWAFASPVRRQILGVVGGGRARREGVDRGHIEHGTTPSRSAGTCLSC